MIKAIVIILIVLVVLFLLSLVVYFFNLDMKLSAKMQKPLEKHYDRIKRDKRL